MRTEPLFEVTAFDACDDPACGCETCVTPWGTEVPAIEARRPHNTTKAEDASRLPGALEFAVVRCSDHPRRVGDRQGDLAVVLQFDQSLRGAVRR